jgi:predicted amidophosphoribosyltransferase
MDRIGRSTISFLGMLGVISCQRSMRRSRAVQCPSCNVNVPVGSKFCPDCGPPLPRLYSVCGH